MMSKAPYRFTAAKFILLGSLWVLAGCGWFSKSDPKSSAEAFFSLLRNGNTSAAYDSAAFVFQAEQNLQRFEVTVKELGLADFQSIDWTRSVLKGNEAKLDVNVATKDGRKEPVEVTLIKESGRWKVYALHTASEGDGIAIENKFSVVGKSADFNQVFKPSLPDEGQVKDLVLETLVKFNDAIQQKSIDDFYTSMSKTTQTYHSKKMLKQAFHEFMDKNIDCSAVKNTDLLFETQPLIDNEGLLQVSGSFNASPYQITFKLNYTYELPKWRLSGFSMNFITLAK